MYFIKPELLISLFPKNYKKRSIHPLLQFIFLVFLFLEVLFLSYVASILGLPMHTRALWRVDIQPLNDEVATRLKKCAISKLDKIRHGFLWNGTADANVGHCLV
jgi:hypothetical protein